MITLENLDEHYDKTVKNFSHQLSKIQSGRANASLIEDILVESYGNKVPLKNIANITVPESRQLLVQPWDQSSVVAIEKTILASNLGLSPKNEGRAIRIMIPQMTEERRSSLIKVVGEYAEKSKISIRTQRADAIKHIRSEESEGNITEDESRKKQALVQKKTDATTEQIESLEKEKTDEISQIG